MKVYHLRRNKWVKHNKITRQLTFASTIGDAISLCKQDYAKHTRHNIDQVIATHNGPFIYCFVSTLTKSPAKVYKIDSYSYYNTLEADKYLGSQTQPNLC